MVICQIRFVLIAVTTNESCLNCGTNLPRPVEFVWVTMGRNLNDQILAKENFFGYWIVRICANPQLSIVLE